MSIRPLRLRSYAAVLLVVLAATLATVGVTPVGASHAVTLTPMSGRLVSSATGKPVSGVRVTIRRWTASTTVVASAVTNAKGYFKTAGLRADVNGYVIRVSARAAGYRSGWVGGGRVQPLFEDAGAYQPSWVGVVKLRRL
jgi:hypothetical protein